MINVTEQIGFMARANKPTIDFQGVYYSAPGTASVTHTGVAFGPATDDRYVLCAMQSCWDGGALNTLVTGVTIGGVAATIIATEFDNYIKDCTFGMAIAKIPASVGASGSVAVTMSGIKYYHQLAVWNLTGLNSPIPIDVKTNTNRIGTTSAEGISLAAPQGSIIAAFAGYRANGIGYVSTMSGVTKEFELSAASNPYMLFSGGSGEGSGGNRNIFLPTPAFTAANRQCIIGASFR